MRMAQVKSVSKSSAAETAKYIGGMARELLSMAMGADLGFLAYLLSMVQQEADATPAGDEQAPDRKTRAGAA